MTKAEYIRAFLESARIKSVAKRLEIACMVNALNCDEEITHEFMAEVNSLIGLD